MKIASLVILSMCLVTSSAVFADHKDPIEVCSNLSASIRLIAIERDTGADLKQLESKKLKTSKAFSFEQIIQIVEKTPFLKPNVLSNAFASACMAEDHSNTLNIDYYKQFEGCNPYTENEELVFKCVTNIVSF